MKKKLLLLCLASATTAAFGQNTGIGTILPTDQLHTTGTVRFQGYAGPGTRLVQIDTAGRLLVTGAGPVFSNSSVISIPDNGCANNNGAVSAITVSGQATAVASTKIAVRVNIAHTYDGDLKIYLFAPNGQVLNLAESNGGSGDNFSNTVFTDLAQNSISTGSAPFTGKYKPMAGVAAPCFSTSFAGSFSIIGIGSIVPNGTWTLKVYDASLSDIGTLNGWDISFSGPESFTTADQNNYLPKFSGGNLVSSSLYQLAGGNIGVGTTAPAAALDIAKGRLRFSGDPSGGITQGVEFTNSVGSTLNGFIGGFNDSMIGLYGYTGAGWRFLFNNTNGNVGLQGNNNPRASLSFANTTGNKIALWGNADVAHYGIGIQGSALQLYTDAASSDILLGYGSSAAFTENMRVKGNGNVGIGIAPTVARLEVQSPSSSLLLLANSTLLGAGVNSDLVFRQGLSYAGMIRSRGVDASHAAMGFYTNATATQSNLTERMTISDGGLVGIGQTTPTEKLEVNGSIKMTDGTQAAGKIMTSDAAGKASWQPPVTTNTAFRASVANTSGLNGYLSIASNSNPLDFDNTGSFNNTTHAFTAPATGVYEFSYSVFVVTIPTPTNSGIIEVDLIKTNAPFATLDGAILHYDSGQPVNDILKGTTVLKLTAGDQVKLSVTGSINSNGAVYDPGFGNYLAGHRLY